jgi:hypothetical protein
MTKRARQEFTAELAQLAGLEVGPPELEEAHEKLAAALGVKAYSEKILEAARRLAAVRMHADRVEIAFDAAIDEGRAMPSQRQTFCGALDSEAAIAAITALKPVVVVPACALDEIDPEQLDLDRRIHAVALERNIGYAAAFDRVLSEL